MMTISVRRSEKYDTLEKCIEFFSSQKYTDNEDLNKSFCWRFYYPVARGDIILMLDSNDFAEATHALYDFVHDNEIIIYSFTIPMISSLWIQSTMEHSNCESNCCSLKLRATVKNYEKLYKLINEIGISDTLSFLASFGTDDVIVDFGQFSEEMDLAPKAHIYAAQSAWGSLRIFFRRIHTADIAGGLNSAFVRKWCIRGLLS